MRKFLLAASALVAVTTTATANGLGGAQALAKACPLSNEEANLVWPAKLGYGPPVGWPHKPNRMVYADDVYKAYSFGTYDKKTKTFKPNGKLWFMVEEADSPFLSYLVPAPAPSSVVQAALACLKEPTAECLREKSPPSCGAK